MSTRHAQRGMTLLEVMIALGILMVVMGALATILTDSIRFNASAGQRTQAVQVLNYLGRQVVGGNANLMPPSGSQLSWDYGELGNAFSDLNQGDHFADPDNYRARVSNKGQPASLAGSGVSLDQYEIEVCWKSRGKDVCVRATTLSSPPPTGGTPPPLPGIN